MRFIIHWVWGDGTGLKFSAFRSRLYLSFPYSLIPSLKNIKEDFMFNNTIIRRSWAFTVLMICVIGSCCAADTVTIIDERGKQFEVPQPLERVCIFNTFNVEFARAVGGWPAVVGMDANAAQDEAYWPGFDRDNIVGQNQREPDYEKIAALNTQVVIFPSNGAWAEAEEKLAPFGIQVIVLTGWAMEGFVERLTNFGLLFGNPERAQELINFYQQHLDLVQERIGALEQKKRVYYESYGAASDFKTCLVGSGWNDMLVMAGGINVFGDLNIAEQPETKGSVHAFDVDPEAILVRNPQLVLKIEPGSQARPGTGTQTPPDPAELKAAWERLVNRPGWSGLDAVKNGQVHVMSPFPANACSKMIGVCYLAKWLYPELFPDLDPEAVMREWIEKFQDVPYSEGGYVYP
jgi:iron complex transport system substrate-binding protein